MTDVKLKPCPFCGSENLEIDEGYRGKYYRCVDCETYGPDAKETEGAAEKWNQRVEEKTE